MIGMCGIPGPPVDNGIAEMAYGNGPAYQGKEYATEAARGLIEFAPRRAGA
jgi:RimJ/RimL family protein N-acetyltransferase